MTPLGRFGALTALLLMSGAPWSALADGGVALGVTTLLQSGDPAAKEDITFIGDGFTEDQQDEFNDKVDELIEKLLATHPFFPLRSAFNITVSTSDLPSRAPTSSRNAATKISKTKTTSRTLRWTPVSAQGERQRKSMRNQLGPG